MYYLMIENDDENDDESNGANDRLVYYCRNCGDKNKELAGKNICVSKTTVNHAEQNNSSSINEYTKYDPTLPHTNMIKCPNSDCESNGADGKRDVLYNRYDDKNMKYIYMCAVCDTSWKTSQDESKQK
jgi:DNA-directed RNA polymerase subunit M/transcription elongation factor TFIIS|tara:strand:- start:664 stop:1047 length:384 start_codon:yes stop_codon:yes gene_type:complete